MVDDKVIWSNLHFPLVTIEIRRGNDVIPEHNPIIATPSLAQGQSHTETSAAEDFYWIRKNPPSDGIYNHRPIYGNGSFYQENI